MKHLVSWLILLFLPIASARADGFFVYGIPSFGAPAVIVSALPACNAAANGKIYTVTDALAPTIAGIVVGGGAVTLEVHIGGWLLKRDLTPVNDNDLMWLEKAA